MKKILYYHITETDNSAVWSNMFLEQMALVESSGLLASVDEIRTSVVCKGNKKVPSVKGLSDYYKEKMKVTFHEYQFGNDHELACNLDNPNTVTESVALKKIYHDCLIDSEITTVGYIHTKGITAVTRFLDTGNYEQYRNYFSWRQLLNWGVIEKWRDCHEMLNEHGFDVVGALLKKSPSPHFSGNFWWATASHIRQLPNPTTSLWWSKVKENSHDPWLQKANDRYKDEHWIFSRERCKAGNIGNIPEEVLPFNTYIPKTLYRNQFDEV